MSVSAEDRIVSVLSYVTFGIFGIIWLIFTKVTNRHTGMFAYFNMFQAMFFSIVLAAISILYGIAINVLSAIPIIGNIAKAFHLYFNATPMYFSCTISGLLVNMLLIYLCVMSLIGKKPYLPAISETVDININGR